MQGRIHSVESFGSADGPGVRFLIFLQGCPMRCRYCHNPDTWKLDGGTLMEADELLDKAERYRSYWGPEGGITVSGGEALMQVPFVTELFEKAHERGINTCLDTSLAPYTTQEPWHSNFERLMASTDFVLADIKHIDPVEHQKLTGHGNENILEALRWLSDHKIPVWIRHVMVPGLTLTRDRLTALAAYLKPFKCIQRIDLLPFHKMAEYKWEQLHIQNTLLDTPEPTKEEIRMAEEIFFPEKFGKH